MKIAACLSEFSQRDHDTRSPLHLVPSSHREKLPHVCGMHHQFVFRVTAILVASNAPVCGNPCHNLMAPNCRDRL